MNASWVSFVIGAAVLARWGEFPRWYRDLDRELDEIWPGR
jgi:hypothetical protein